MEKSTYYPYPILGGFMDAGQNVARVQPGTMSRVVGVDGRFRGCVKPFPGFNRVKDLTEVTNVGTFTYAPSFFKYVEVQKGATSYLLRGYVVKYGDGTTNQTVKFIYYDTGTSAWACYDIRDNWNPSASKPASFTSTVQMDVTYTRRFLYVAIQGVAPQVIYHNGTNMVQFEMGPGASYVIPSAPTATSSPEATTGGFLLYGDQIGIAYQFYDSTRNLYSGMSSVLVYNVTSTTGTAKVRVTTSGTVPTQYDRIILYRTISATVVGNSYEGGLLYKERILTNTAWATGEDGTANSAYVGVLRDNEVSMQDRYDPWADEAAVPPYSGAISCYQGMTLMAEAADSVTGGAGFRWSAPHIYNPENLPASQQYRPDVSDGAIVRFIEAGDAIFAFTANIVYRIQKTGGQITIARMHYGRGITAPFAGHGVGRDTVYLSPSGLTILDGVSGNAQEVGAVDRIILNEWYSTLSNVHSAFDAKMAVSFFGNTSTKTAICLWHGGLTTGVLEDWDFRGITSGPLPTTGGIIRAVVISPRGVVLTPDCDRTGTFTMNGITASKTLNGTATSGSTTNLTDTAATFDSTMVGAYLHMLSGLNAGTSQIISAIVSTTGLTTAAFTNANAVGDRYTVSPVPFKLRLWPVPVVDDTLKVQDGFLRRVLKGMGVHTVGVTGYTDTAYSKQATNALWTLGAYRQAATTLATSAMVAMGLDPSDSHVAFSIDGTLIEPAIELTCSGVDFELTNVEVIGTMGNSRTAG